MGLSVYDREGPYFSSGEIKWSQLRNTFKEVSSGSISAKELKRNTNPNERDPIVPDAVANEDIAGWNFSSGTGDPNWKASQMRDSYKRYWARQTGTDINLRMGRYDSSGGIDWGGYGLGGRDSTSSGNGNLTKNIQKFIKIEGTCGSNDSGTWGGQNNDPGAGTWTPGKAAAKLAPQVPARNVRIWVYGRIHGAGGEGGYDSRGYTQPSGPQNGADPGTPGGTALRIDNPNGNDVWINIKSGSAQIWGGGGGGEQGRNGDVPVKGTCSRTWNTSGCGSAPNCSASDGGTVETVSTWEGSCCSWYEQCWWGWGVFCNEHCGNKTQNRQCKETIDSILPTQGIGGRGGNGQGYNLTRTNGQNGTDPDPKENTCQSDYDYNEDGVETTAGSRGGDGGNWGQNGANTSANNAQHDPQPSNGGIAGAAICGNKFTLSGTVNNNTLKGSYSGSCPGVQSSGGGTISPPNVSLSQSGSGPFTLTWACTSSSTITNVFGQSTPSDNSWNPTTNSGSITVNPSQTTTYKVFAQNAGGTGSAQTTCNISGGGATLTNFTITRNSSDQLSITYSKVAGTGIAQMNYSRSSNGTSTVQYDISPGARYKGLTQNISTSPNAAGVPSLMRVNPNNNKQIQFEESIQNPNWDAMTVTAAEGSFTEDTTAPRFWPLYIRGLRFHNTNGTHNSNGVWGGQPQIQAGGQTICMHDYDGSDCNATFSIVSKDSSVTSAQFVAGSLSGTAPGEPPSTCSLAITGGGNVQLKLEWNDNINQDLSAMTSIICRGKTWIRNTGAFPHLIPYYNYHLNNSQYNPNPWSVVSVNNNGSWNGSKVTIPETELDLKSLGVISISGNATLSKTVTWRGQTFTVFVKAIPWNDPNVAGRDGWRSEWWMTSTQHVHEFHRGEIANDPSTFRFLGSDYTAPGSAIRFRPSGVIGNLDFGIEFHKNSTSEGDNFTNTTGNDSHTIALSGGNIDYNR